MLFKACWLKLKNSSYLALLAALISVPVLAETANFGTLTLSRGFSSNVGTLIGTTGGSYSLSAIRKSDGKNLCIGFGDPTPDHILVLEQEFTNLTVQVDSQGKDTTLVIQGPNDSTFYCGDDTGSSKDASVTHSHWQAGTYRIWVGALEQGGRYHYRLSIQE